ncbi:S8 family serine peptidase [Micromonospora sp. NPDC050417]|uniref:S8 family serine peptidase n=1 Tax=Micromonospora sp. NPDC050417 TaxID=3364280 RepID=UPI0037AC98A3
MGTKTSRRPGAGPLGPSRFRRTLTVVTALVLGVTAQPAVATAAPPSATVDAQVLRELSGQGSTSFMVYLRERADLDGAATLRDTGARGIEVHRQLTATATRTQAGLRADLDARKTAYTSYWIANALHVRGDRALVDAIAARPEVARIEPVKVYPLITPVPSRETSGRTPQDARNGAEWGLNNIEAPRVWSEYGDRGEGVVVANIDTGVQHNHPALVGSYRGNLGNGTFDHNYNWFDPAAVCFGAAPCDNNGHGTHTMGTMVGDDGAGNQVGVAPGARWIAAKGCESTNCSETSLLASGQWILAPTDVNGQNPRPDLHPDVVNNSWGGGQGDTWYEATVTAWRSAGIFPVFAAGNTLGLAPCGSVSSPGDSASSYSVGAYDVDNKLGTFSNRGPTIDGRTKPNIAAPGVAVRSSVPGNAYDEYDGTSMATPHVAGTVALVWSAAPTLRGDVTSTEALLGDTATDTDAVACGGTVDNNNMFGEGRLNAYQAVTAAPRGPVGQVTGTVTNRDTGAPLAGAAVIAGRRSTTTGADGRYLLNLAAGDQEITVSAFGYTSRTVTVSVPEGGSVTADVALVKTQSVTVTGRVTDGSGHGWPLYASIEITGRPGEPVFTHPVTGRYSVTLPGDATYTITVAARSPGYRTVTRDLDLGTGATTVNIAVPVTESCEAAGYRLGGDPLISESFEGTHAPEGWSVTNRTDGSGWAFVDPVGRGNLTGGSGGFAIVDSNFYGDGKSQDTDLVAPALNLTGVEAPYLTFGSDFWSGGTDNVVDVDVSGDGGATWTNVWRQNTSRRGPRIEEVPLTPIAGAADALLRFRYQASYDWWWQIDNVRVVNRVCSTLPGGLVAGFVTDRNTGAGVNGATVASPDAPAERGVTAATPDDPNIGDGFYSFFSTLTGTHPVDAGRTTYQTLTKDVAMLPDGTRRADFVLKAGQLSVTSERVGSQQPYGSTRTTTVTVRNTGSAPATVDLIERPGEFDLLAGRKGAPLIEQPVEGVTPAANRVPRFAAQPGTSGPLAEDAWTRIPDLPGAVFDNAAVAFGGKVYSFGSHQETGNGKKAWVYDPKVDSWSALPDLPTARAAASAAVVGGRIYLIGGRDGADGTAVGTVDVFDPATSTWSTLAGVTNPAPVASAGTAVTDGRIYLVGGCADDQCPATDRLTVFDPATGGFRTAAGYPKPVGLLACGGIRGIVYCAGGISGRTSYRDAYAYSPVTDEWTALPEMPVDMWGTQHGVAGGLLVIAGGIANNSATMTNRTMAYDPATGAWRALPNVGVPVYRGALACGAYKIGGSPTQFGTTVEKLAGLGGCDSESGTPWLTTSPARFTLAPGATQKVTVTLTATAETGIDQPGAYHAQLELGSDTPYPRPTVDVELNVAPPETWGKVQGTVVGLTCAGQRVPVRALVQLNRGGTGYTVNADSQGRYAYWVPSGRYQVIVARDGWIPKAKQQQVDAGFIATLDFTLDPAPPCGSRLGGI